MVQPTVQQKCQYKCSKTVFKLIDKHLLKGNKLHKIFNRDSVKVSYSYTENMKSIFSAHNKKLLSQNIDKIHATAESRTNTH